MRTSYCVHNILKLEYFQIEFSCKVLYDVAANISHQLSFR